MKMIYLIARDSIKALLHQRLLMGLMLASICVTVVFAMLMVQVRGNVTSKFDVASSDTNSPAFKNMGAEDKKKMGEAMEQGANFVEGAFYAATSFGGSLVALLIFSTAVTSEIRRGTIRLTLSKPVTRPQYLIGKYLGGVVVMAGYAVIASVAVLAFSASEKVELSPVLRYAPLLMFCRQLMLGSVAMLLSLFMHPAIGSVLAFFCGNGWCGERNPLYYLLPSYAPFNVFSEVLSGTVVEMSDVVLLALYATDFVALMLLLALWRFNKKEVC